MQDIFDVSKASSGEMKLDIEELDLVKLIRQTLADMDEDISGSNLIFKINLPNDPVMIRGDGERCTVFSKNVIKIPCNTLWRVPGFISAFTGMIPGRQ